MVGETWLKATATYRIYRRKLRNSVWRTMRDSDLIDRLVNNYGKSYQFGQDKRGARRNDPGAEITVGQPRRN